MPQSLGGALEASGYVINLNIKHSFPKKFRENQKYPVSEISTEPENNVLCKKISDDC
jgi:hypothetical protein